MDDDLEPTQPATQELPPHNGVAPSKTDGQDYSDIICFLHPCTSAAISVVRRAQANNPNLIVSLDGGTKGRRASRDNHSAEGGEDAEPTQVDNCTGQSMAIDLALRRSPGPNNPEVGFVFGRNQQCDISLTGETANSRISGKHFRIYVNDKSALMLEDMSTNGTFVDEKFLGRNSPHGRMRVLSPGSIIYLCAGKEDELIRFVVRIPRDTGRGFKSTRLPDSSPAASIPRFSLSPNVGLPRVGAVSPGVVQSPQQRNAAAISRNPLANRPADEWQELLHSSSRDIEDKYALEREIGKGAFATVQRAHVRTTGDVVAVKSIVKKVKNLGEKVVKSDGKKEVNILMRLKHPNVVQFIEYYEDSMRHWIVMEYIEHGDLDNYLRYHGTMSEPLTKKVARQVLKGLEYIHQKGVTHRDLKPPNILIASEEPDMVVKISDFGLAKLVNNEETFLLTFCGSLGYLAPEVFPEYLSVLMAQEQGLDGNPKRKRLLGDDDGPADKGDRKKRRGTTADCPYNQAVDMWSFGCIIYCLLCGHPPWETNDKDQMQRLVTRGLFDEGELRKNVGEDYNLCIDFLRKLLNVYPDMRMTEAQALRHKWLNEKSDTGNASAEYASDEVVGVDYGSRQRSFKDSEGTADSDYYTHHPEGGHLPEPRSNKKTESDLQGIMAGLSFSQLEANYDLCTSNTGGSGSECFESIINSGYESGVSVIDRAKADAQCRGTSWEEIHSSTIFPGAEDWEIVEQEKKEGEKAEGEEEEEEEEEPSPQRLGGAFDYHAGFREPIRRNQFESRLNRLAFERDEARPPSSSPDNNADSPWSTAHFNYSPESLKTESPKSKQPLAPNINTPKTSKEERVTCPEDDELPSTPSVLSQTPSRVSPVPWGRLIPLPGSLATEPVTLVGQMVIFGRGLLSDVRFDDVRISKDHFAIQLTYPDRARQTSPRGSRAGEWKPAPDMVATFLVKARTKVYVNGKPFGEEAHGRLFDGDEIIFFKDHHPDKPKEYVSWGYRAELTAGDVKRGSSELPCSIDYNFKQFDHLGYSATHRNADRSFSSGARAEVPGGQNKASDDESERRRKGVCIFGFGMGDGFFDSSDAVY